MGLDELLTSLINHRVTNPEILALISKASKDLGLFFEDVGAIFEKLAQTSSKQQVVDSSTDDKITASEETLGMKVKDHSTDSSTQQLLISKEELEKPDGGSLIDIIAKHCYHLIIPGPLTIGGQTFYQNEYYSFKQAAQALGKKIQNLYMMSSTGKVHTENRKISGYEIIRLYMRPNSRKMSTEQELAEQFHLSQEIVERLLRLNVLESREAKAGSKLIVKVKISDFYDKIFPIKGTDRYTHLMSLLGVAKDDTLEEHKASRHLAYVVTPREALEPSTQESTQNRLKGRELIYIPSSLLPFKDGVDYELVPDGFEQNPDAFYVRHLNSKVPKKTKKEGEEINLNDVLRLHLAKVYIPEVAISEEFRSKLGQYDKEMVLRALNLAEMRPIVYKGNLVFPPGTSDIATIADEEIKRIVRLAKPIVDRDGTFISLKQIQELIGSKFNKMEFHQKRSSGEFESIEINDQKLYNVFQVVRSYLTVLEPSQKVLS